MTFQDAVRVCLTQKYARFEGRARRSEFWFFVLFSAIVRTIANLLDALIGHGNGTTGGPISTIVFLALLVPSIAVGVRRLHDTGRSGWWWLIVLIPLVGIIVLVVFWAQDSRPDNQYGPNPKAALQESEPGYPPVYPGGQAYGGSYPTGQEYPAGDTQPYPSGGTPQAYPGAGTPEPYPGGGTPEAYPGGGAPQAYPPPPPAQAPDPEYRPPSAPPQ